MFRIKIVLIAIGCVAAFIGYEEFKLSSLAKETPEVLNMSEVEALEVLENAHLKIGPHAAFYFGIVYEYESDKHEMGELKDTTKIIKAYYPVVSAQHPFMVSLNALYDRYPNGIPEGVSMPQINDLKVLVKTDRFSNIGALPENYLVNESGIQGVVINEIESLGNEEAALIRESFPNVDLDKVFILEEGRLPSSSGKNYSMMGGGAILALFGLAWLIAGFRR